MDCLDLGHCTGKEISIYELKPEIKSFNSSRARRVKRRDGRSFQAQRSDQVYSKAAAVTSSSK